MTSPARLKAAKYYWETFGINLKEVPLSHHQWYSSDTYRCLVIAPLATPVINCFDYKVANKWYNNGLDLDFAFLIDGRVYLKSLEQTASYIYKQGRPTIDVRGDQPAFVIRKTWIVT